MKKELTFGQALERLRALEQKDRVDHSTHIDADGNGCAETRTWNSRMGRDIAIILDKAGVVE
jgi:hypothetical protein